MSAYRLRRDEPLADGIRRVARGRVQSALDELRGKTESSPDEAVHEARKDMKKLRALLRMARPELGEDLFGIENAAARDTARLLAGARDAAVMVETLEGLPGRYPGLRRALEQRKAGPGTAAGEAIASLREMRKRVGHWPLDRDGFGLVEGGLRRVYRQGRRAMRRAEVEPTDENLHEWRKREKDLWYHLRLLRDAWPDPMRAAAGEADALSERLGDDHDLAVLLAIARETGEADELEPVAARRRGKLQAEAFAIGGRLYAERPRAFAERVRAWWEAGARLDERSRISAVQRGKTS
jgi:CHAD domain-containing protein